MKDQYLKIFKLLLCFFIISLATSCASLNAVKDAAGIKNPSVTLGGMKITDLTMENAGLALTLNVDNPNPIPINLAGFDYALLFDGKQLLAGEKRDQFKIDAQGVSTVTVPISLNFADLKKLYQGVLNQDTLNYELQTTALVDLPVIGVKKFPSTQKGEFPVPKIPEVSLGGINVKKMGLSGAEVVINANIKNPNSFGIDVSQLAYNLSINGSQWAESALEETIKLAEKGETQINIPLKLNFLEMGSALYSALMKGEGLNYQFTGDMNLDTALPMLKNVKVPFDKSGVVGVQR
ncbi:MAG: LEA type 2 family protein [Gammaproteobacteria bacterium]|nr:LEA type 2 family protein [Gammaproteobacteria bacterium]